MEAHVVLQNAGKRHANFILLYETEHDIHMQDESKGDFYPSLSCLGVGMGTTITLFFSLSD